MDEQQDDADGDDEQRAEDGGAAHGASLLTIKLALGAEGELLGAGLIFHLLAGEASLVARVEAGRGVRGRVAGGHYRAPLVESTGAAVGAGLA